MIYSTRNRRKLTLETLMTMPSEPESKAFYTYTDGDDRIEVLNDTFTLVLSRDVRKNAKIAAEMAFAIAKEHTDYDVFYVNTYAGVTLMKEAFTKALEKSGIQPPPDPRLEKAGEIIEESLEKEEEIDDEEDDEDYDWDDEDDDEEDEDEEPDDEEPEHGPSLLPNLFIYDVPLGTWETERLKADVLGRGRGNKDSASETGTTPHSAPANGTTPQPPPIPRIVGDAGSIGGGVGAVVILNSFEFASMNRGQREKMVMQLIELRDTLGLTFLIFSHEMKRDLAAGLPGRGPLGIISAQAGSVQRLNDPFEHLIRNRKKENLGAPSSINPSKRAENGVIHEAQMRAPNLRRYEPYRKIPVFRTELEKMQWFREQQESPDYFADPWQNRTQMLGRDLLLLARSRVLRKYYEEHKDHVFTKGLEPTEYEIITGTYEANEFERKYLL